jgi:fanconi anemia group J protein
VIFTSGTLAPLNTYASELETIFPVKLENDHVIPKDNHQVMVGILENDIENQKICFSYEKREDSNFFINFAKTLSRIFQTIP